MTVLDLLFGIISLSIIVSTIINSRKYNLLEDYIIGRGFAHFLLFWFKCIFLLLSLFYFSSRIDLSFLTYKVF